MGPTVARSGTGPKGRLPHPEHHRTQRVGWLRAAVLGANDGIVSTASLIVGVAAADTSRADDAHRGCRRARRRGDVDGGRRVRLGQLAARRRASRPRPGAPRARRRPGERAQRADPHLRTTRPRATAWPPRWPASSPTTTPSAPTSATSWGSPTWRVARPMQAARFVGRRVHRRRPGPAARRAGQHLVATDRRHRRRRPRRPGRPRRRSARASAAPRCGAAVVRITVLSALAMAVTAAIGAAVGTAVG